MAGFKQCCVSDGRLADVLIPSAQDALQRVTRLRGPALALVEKQQPRSTPKSSGGIQAALWTSPKSSGGRDGGSSVGLGRSDVGAQDPAGAIKPTIPFASDSLHDFPRPRSPSKPA